MCEYLHCTYVNRLSHSSHAVVLYSCPELAVDCSTCIGLNDNFNCAYCTSTDSGSCMLSTLTCSPGPLIRPQISTCPSPMITEVCILCNAMNILIYVHTLALWYSLGSVYTYVHKTTFYHFLPRPLHQLVLLKEVLCTLSEVATLVLIPERMSLFCLVKECVR